MAEINFPSSKSGH